MVDDHGFQTVLERLEILKSLNFCMLVLQKCGIKYTEKFYFHVAIHILFDLSQNIG